MTKGEPPHTVTTMGFSKKQRRSIEILLGCAVIVSIIVGIGLGIALAETRNIEIHQQIGEYSPAIPSQILDRHGNLITEFFAEQKREIVPVEELPKNLIYALIAREDKNFFQHKGFDPSGLIRAAWNIVSGKFFSGGSTITQQIAGVLYADRRDISIKRKLKELWWAFQLERNLTKYEILELYLNKVYFGHNTYGVESASQFYFGHSARDLSPAESAILVVQLASPSRYSPINHPNRAKERQKEILDQMVAQGYLTFEEAEYSYLEYWNSYDYTRSNIASAYFDNLSKAPYFSEYIRLQLENMLLGSLININEEGFTVHTTLDLNYQRIAEDLLLKGLAKANSTYRANTEKRLSYANTSFVPVIDLLSLTFNLEDIVVAGKPQQRASYEYYQQNINPLLNLVSMMFGEDDMNFLSAMAYGKARQDIIRTTVEGALITLENETGYILAMVGGSEFKTKKFNRATDAQVQPGSAFKPLYYAAAISSKKYTPATRLHDSPMVFYYSDGRPPYTPANFLGTWNGYVLLRDALAQSMNVPSIQVLNNIGFEAAIDMSSKLLGMYNQRNNERDFPRVYPLGLGVISVSPLKMAQAYATFANRGKLVEPLAIRYVEDRSGNIILEPEAQLRTEQKKQGKSLQALDEQSAYIMVNLLQSTVEYGTLANRRREIGGFDGMPMAGKTGTTQNWSDAWTVGFSPYVTTAIWFGFDIPGNSLGLNQTGATAVGPIWANYMKEIHKDLPVKDFVRPSTGLIERRVCSVSGLLPTEYCSDGTRLELFILGTEPNRTCDIHEIQRERDQELRNRIQNMLLIETPPDSFTIPPFDFSSSESFFNLLPQETDTSKENPLLD